MGTFHIQESADSRDQMILQLQDRLSRLEKGTSMLADRAVLNRHRVKQALLAENQPDIEPFIVAALKHLKESSGGGTDG
jgi:hypothetical protein